MRKQTFDSEFVQGSISLGVAEQRLELWSGAFRQTSSWPWPRGAGGGGAPDSSVPGQVA